MIGKQKGQVKILSKLFPVLVTLCLFAFPLHSTFAVQPTDILVNGSPEGDERSHLKPLSIRTLQDLSFGRLSADSHLRGNVVINPADGNKLTQNVRNLGGLHTPAELEILGEPNKRFFVTLPDSVYVPGGNGSDYELKEFRVHPNKVGVLGPDGKAIILVGATLTIDAEHPGGQSGRSIDIFVDYLP